MVYIAQCAERDRFHTNNTGKSYILVLIPEAKWVFLIVYKVLSRCKDYQVRVIMMTSAGLFELYICSRGLTGELGTRPGVCEDTLHTGTCRMWAEREGLLDLPGPVLYCPLAPRLTANVPICSPIYQPTNHPLH